MSGWRDTLFPTFQAINRFVRQSLTAGGKALLLIMLISLFGLVYLETPLIFLLSSLLAIMIVAGIVSFLLRPQMSCRILAPEIVKAREPVSLDIFMENRRRWTSYDLLVEAIRNPKKITLLLNENPLVDEVKSKNTARASVPFAATDRGITRFPFIQISSTFPFNLFRFRQTFKVPGELVVLPHFHPLKKFSFEDDWNQLAGNLSNSSHLVEDSETLLGSREFVPGMRVKRWDYPSWARTSKPTIREYQSNQQQGASLFVDTFGATEIDDSFSQRFEATLSLAAAIVDRLTKIDFDLEHVMLGDFDLGHKWEHVENIRPDQVNRQLALAETVSVEMLDGMIASDQMILPGSDVLFVILNGWDEQRARLYQQFDITRNYLCTIVVTDETCPITNAPHLLIEVTVDQIKSGEVEI